MSLYRVAQDKLESVLRTSYSAENILERNDLQRLLRNDISPVGDDLMVIAEEFGDWEDSTRRIDLLCLNKVADLVVIEIKRTEDGGHMELQSIRYAAMVSSMTLDQVIKTYSRFKSIDEELAKTEVLGFLEIESDEEKELTGEVRIVLVSANFSTELTTAVLWLNRHELDITCIRLCPYKLGDQVLIDATQIIPLPESEDYEIRVREQEKEKRKVLGGRQEIFRRFWARLIEHSCVRTQLFANRKPNSSHWLAAGIGRSGFNLAGVLTQHTAQVECYIRIGGPGEKSKSAFTQLFARKAEIEAKFGAELIWQELPDRNGCRICSQFPGGWKSPEQDWQLIQDRMIDEIIRMEAALKKPIQELKL